MGRTIRWTAAAGVIALTATTAWALGERTQLQTRVATLQGRLGSTNDRLATSFAAQQVISRTSRAASQRVEALSKRVHGLEMELYGTRLDLRRVRPVLDALLLGRDREVFETRLLQGDDHDLLAVSWHESRGGITLTGIDVWRVRGGNTAARVPASWELAYVVEPQPSYDLDHPSYVVYGPPEAPIHEEVDFIQRIDIADVGDATGDGLDDLATWEAGSGSGGCGHVKLLQNLGKTLREVYRHEDCDHGLAIKRGHLVLHQAWQPRGCEQIHGCGTRSTWMRWTGSSWVVTDVRREAY